MSNYNLLVSIIVTDLIFFGAGIAVGLAISAFLFLTKVSKKNLISQLDEFIQDKEVNKPAGVIMDTMTDEEEQKLSNPEWTRFNRQANAGT